MTARVLWLGAWQVGGIVYWVKRAWDKFGEWCEKYLKANKEFQ
jgi:hypothetical protein